MKVFLTIIYVIVCVILIGLSLMQTSEDGGASETIVGKTSSNFYEKNKGRTREGKLKRWTIILGIVFFILTVILGIVYMM